MDEYNKGYNDGFKKGIDLFEYMCTNLEFFTETIVRQYNNYMNNPTESRKSIINVLLSVAFYKEISLDLWITNIAGKEYEEKYRERLDKISNKLDTIRKTVFKEGKKLTK